MREKKVFLKIRVPKPAVARLKSAAKRNGRSMNAEAVFILTSHLINPSRVIGLMRAVRDEMEGSSPYVVSMQK